MEQSFPPPENFFCHHETWLSCRYFLPKESRLCREARFSWCAQGLPSSLMLLAGGTPSIFPGVCEIQSVLEEPNLWLNEKYLRYCLPHSNHRANEGLHHVAMKLVMAFKCSGVSIHPCSSLTMQFVIMSQIRHSGMTTARLERGGYADIQNYTCPQLLQLL